MNHKAIIILTIILNVIFTAVHAQNVYVNLENSAVQRYLSEVTYISEDDSSEVTQYCTQTGLRLDLPEGAVISIPETMADSIVVKYELESDLSDTTIVSVPKDQRQVKIYNLLPQQLYNYQVLADGEVLTEGTICTLGQVRMIYAPSIRNIRDMGGWVNQDGQRIKYGKLYRGGELNGEHVADSVDIATLIQLGIGAELDLRAWYNEGSEVSVFGFLSITEVESGEVPSYLYTNDSGMLVSTLTNYNWLSRWKQEFEFIVNNLRIGRAVYQHCKYGADRTGYLSVMLEGLLGVPYDGLVKDYELTSFSETLHKKSTIDEVISFMRKLDGETLQEKFNTFFVKRLGVSQSDIAFFLEEMLEENELISVGVKDSFCNRETYRTGRKVYDIWGRETQWQNHRTQWQNSGRGIVIEVTEDGRVRKVVR